MVISRRTSCSTWSNIDHTTEASRQAWRQCLLQYLPTIAVLSALITVRTTCRHPAQLQRHVMVWCYQQHQSCSSVTTDLVTLSGQFKDRNLFLKYAICGSQMLGANTLLVPNCQNLGEPVPQSAPVSMVLAPARSHVLSCTNVEFHVRTYNSTFVCTLLEISYYTQLTVRVYSFIYERKYGQFTFVAYMKLYVRT